MDLGTPVPTRADSRSTAGEGSATIVRVDLLSTLPAFVLAVLLISASPGPAMALIFRRAALRGLRGAVPTVLGLELGLYVWALFAGAGSPRWWPRPRWPTSCCGWSAPPCCWSSGSGRCGPPGAGGPRPSRSRRPRAGRRWWGAFGEGVVVSWPTRRPPSS